MMIRHATRVSSNPFGRITSQDIMLALAEHTNGDMQEVSEQKDAKITTVDQLIEFALRNMIINSSVNLTAEDREVLIDQALAADDPLGTMDIKLFELEDADEVYVSEPDEDADEIAEVMQMEASRFGAAPMVSRGGIPAVYADHLHSPRFIREVTEEQIFDY
jgi:hypothetical protein